jgi:hypothetical protein
MGVFGRLDLVNGRMLSYGTESTGVATEPLAPTYTS